MQSPSSAFCWLSIGWGSEQDQPRWLGNGPEKKPAPGHPHAAVERLVSQQEGAVERARSPQGAA